MAHACQGAVVVYTCHFKQEENNGCSIVLIVIDLHGCPSLCSTKNRKKRRRERGEVRHKHHVRDSCILLRIVALASYFFSDNYII